MSTTIIDDVPMTVREALAEARAARDEGMATAENADMLRLDKAAIDKVIDSYAATGEPFSANEIRDLLPEVRSALMGSRFHAAAVQRRTIRRIGRTTSTKRNTHYKPIDQWIGIPADDQQEPA